MNSLIEEFFGEGTGKYVLILFGVIVVCIAAYKITELLIAGGTCKP